MQSARDLFEHELQSVYDGVKRLQRGLDQMRKRAGNSELSSKLQELQSATGEQVRRLEDIFHLLGKKPQRSESKAIQGFLDEFSDALKQEKPEKEALDVLAGDVTSHIASYLMEDYETMLLLAERSGVTHSDPRIAGHLKVSLREEKKLSKDIQKLAEPLIDQLPPG